MFDVDVRASHVTPFMEQYLLNILELVLPAENFSLNKFFHI